MLRRSDIRKWINELKRLAQKRTSAYSPNVVHEIGLFQGRLGFRRAIVLMEEGCNQFSNIEGLGQIRFPKGDIRAKSEDIRGVLSREKIIK